MRRNAATVDGGRSSSKRGPCKKKGAKFKGETKAPEGKGENDCSSAKITPLGGRPQTIGKVGGKKKKKGGAKREKRMGKNDVVIM